jgi:hypothetical protein
MRAVRDGDFPFANEWNAVARDALQGTRVHSGCEVSEGGAQDFTLSVTSGVAEVAHDDFEVAEQSVTLESADADDPRYDLVVVGSDATAGAVTGTPSATPQAPPIPDGHALLAIVEVPAGASGVTDATIYDARAVFPSTQFVSKKRESAIARISTRGGSN